MEIAQQVLSMGFGLHGSLRERVTKTQQEASKPLGGMHDWVGRPMIKGIGGLSAPAEMHPRKRTRDTKKRASKRGALGAPCTCWLSNQTNDDHRSQGHS